MFIIVVLGIKSAILHNAPRIADIINTLEGGNLSTKVNKAKVKVPMIKPSWTEDNRYPRILNSALN